MAITHERTGQVEDQPEQQADAEAADASKAPETEGPQSQLKRSLATLRDFWTKLSNDWVMNLSGLLAYNLLMAVFPILLVLLAIAGFILNAISPGAMTQLEHQIGNALPGGSAIFRARTLQQLTQSAGVVFIIGFVMAIITGSRLFITIENCFGIIFRLRSRDVVRQNLMAIGMLLIYAVLVPLMFLASSLATAINNALFPKGSGGFASFLVQVAGIVTAFVIAAIFLGVVYVVVPNRPVHWREVWRGTLVAAALIVVYEILFPIYESAVLKPGNDGALAGFAIVILVFFYYAAFILLLGAEVNSWAAGQRQTAGDVTAIFHEVQAHDTTRGATGPTAGSVAEDLQGGKGAPAMNEPDQAVLHVREDHHTHVEPPRYVEAGQPGSRQAARQTPQMEQRTAEAERDLHRRDGHREERPEGASEDDRARETGDARHPVGSV
jgi:YihY family inner membrane protein